MKKHKKFLAALLSAVLLILSVFTFAACDESRDGLDGQDFNLYSVYQQLVEQGEFEGTYSEFVKQYLDVNVEWNEGESLSSSINAALSSVVSIAMVCEYSYPSSSGGFWGGETTKTTSFIFSGSGVIYSLDKEAGDAYIITNYHVVHDGPFVGDDGVSYTPVSEATYTAYLYGLEQLYVTDDGSIIRGNDYAIPLTVVGYSMANDIAVLKIEDSEVLKNSLAQAVSVGNSDEVAVGDDVFLIGNSLGEGISATSGILSVESETVPILSADDTTLLKIRAMRTDSVANHGNSGGGLFNKEGKLLGILFAGNNQNGTQGTNNVLPINGVQGLVDSILYHCNGTVVNTQKARIGITVYTDSVRQVYDDESNKFGTEEIIKIESVEALSAAAEKLQPGDVLVSLALGDYSVDIKHQWQISDFLWRIRPGDTVSFTVKRAGEEVTEQITFNDGDFISVE